MGIILKRLENLKMLEKLLSSKFLIISQKHQKVLTDNGGVILGLILKESSWYISMKKRGEKAILFAKY